MGKTRSSLSISVRRHFVDGFFFSRKDLFIEEARVLDIGGKRERRGLFDINAYGAQITYVNIESATQPDIVADANDIPVADGSYDIAIMGELLEHVPEPLSVIKEAYRVLRPGGILLATVPFMYPIHADPYDFGRYTETFWRRASDLVGFNKVEVESQGTIFAVTALIAQHLFLAKKVSWRPIQIPLVKFLMWLDRKTTAPLLQAWTTGYGLTFIK